MEKLSQLKQKFLEQKSVTTKTLTEEELEAQRLEEEKIRKLELIKDDLCFNALIMAIIANHDIKYDNYIYPQNLDVSIPVDFGEAGAQGITPDILGLLNFNSK